jgi:hypothetical protein
MSEGGHLDAEQDGVPTSDEARVLASNQAYDEVEGGRRIDDDKGRAH